LKDPKENKIEIDINCYCGCGVLEIGQWIDEDGDFGDVTISHKTRSWEAYSWSPLNIIKRRFNMIWNILIGKEYYFYEVLIQNKSELRKLKEFVNSLHEDKLPYD